MFKVDMAGQRYGRVLVLEFSHRDKKLRQTKWKCLCDCGKVVILNGKTLRSGKSKSCGCYRSDLKRELAYKLGKRNITHGCTKTSEYLVWINMHNRCYKEKDCSYKYYGAKGVIVCDRWKEFTNFLEDMGNKPDSNYTLDRINPYGNYTPDNCRWVTKKDQQRNRREHKLLTHNGKTQCISIWAEEVGLTTNCLWRRIDNGWSVEKALSKPTRKRSLNLTV